MAIKPTTEFPGKIDPADAEYPQGKARNVTIQDDGTGTPWKARLLNDIWGLLQRLLSDASIVPSGNPDTVLVSDYKNSLDAIYPRLAQPNTFTKTQTQFKGADVASTAALILGDGNYFDITGITTITSIGAKGVGTLITLHFDGILTLTHNATTLVLPGGVDVTTADGTEVTLVEYVSGGWRMTGHNRSLLTVSGSFSVSLAPGFTDDRLITHNLGSDNVKISIMARVPTNLQGWVVEVSRPDGKQSYYSGSGGSVSGAGAVPPTGDVRLRTTNRHADTRTIEVSYTIIREDD